MSKNNFKPITFNLPTPTIERLERHAEMLKQKNPGVQISRSDVVRELVERGLAASESDGAK